MGFPQAQPPGASRLVEGQRGFLCGDTCGCGVPLAGAIVSGWSEGECQTQQGKRVFALATYCHQISP